LQLVKLQQDIAVLGKAGLGVAAVSYDSTAVLHDFASRKHITFPLISDHDSDLIRAFRVADPKYRKGNQLDVDTESLYTGSVGFVPAYGMADPSVFVIGTDKRIVWRVVSPASEFRLSAAAILNYSLGRFDAAVSSRVAARGLSVVATSSDSQLGLGTRILLGVQLKMEPGIHVYAPDAGAEYRGISWTMADSKNCWTTSQPSFPASERKTFQFDQEKVSVYENSLLITRALTISPAIIPQEPSIYKAFRATCIDKNSNMQIKGAVQVQACDSRECFAPQSIPVNWKIHFEEPDRQRVRAEIRREFEP
jgi:peroxiredoxin